VDSLDQQKRGERSGNEEKEAVKRRNQERGEGSGEEEK